MNYQGWAVYPETSLAEWGDYECTGTYKGTRVIWQGAHKYSDSNQIVLELTLGAGRTTAGVCVKYYGHTGHLFSFKCRSIREAVRKANYRLRGQLPATIKRAIDGVYKSSLDWRCAYRGEDPLCSFYYPSYEITNGEGLESGDYTFVEKNGQGWHVEFRGSGYTGTGFKADSKFPYWIDRAA